MDVPGVSPSDACAAAAVVAAGPWSWKTAACGRAAPTAWQQALSWHNSYHISRCHVCITLFLRCAGLPGVKRLRGGIERGSAEIDCSPGERRPTKDETYSVRNRRVDHAHSL